MKITFSPLHGLSCVFSVMSELNLDDPGFQSPGAPTPSPPSSGSSSDTATDRRTCLTCHRWMSKKTFDCHTVCVACRGSDCDIGHRCKECTEWPEEELLLYVKHRRSLKSQLCKPKTQAPPPPPPAAPSVPSPHPTPRSDFESRLDVLASQVSALSELFQSRLAAPQAVSDFLPDSQAPSQTRLESDARSPHPVETAGHPQESQALGGSGMEPAEPVTLPYGQAKLGKGVRASVGLGWAPLPASASQAPRQPPPDPGGVFVPRLSSAAPDVAAASFHDPRLGPQPAIGATGWSSAPIPPPRFSSAPLGTPRDSEMKDSDSSSASAALDSAATQLADLIYDFCPEAKPVSDSAPPPRCGFESWFGPSPTLPSSRPRYRIYPRVAAVESEVANQAAALHRRSKPLSAVLSHKVRRYAVVDQPHFAAPQPVNLSFSCLAGAAAVGSKRRGSVTFAEMERLERLLRCQLEATSYSLWMLSGILAMLKRDGFNPSTPGIFNTAISSVSASLVSQARTAASGSVFLRAKRRESLLVHSKVPIPEPQKRALIVTPGSDYGLFSEPLLNSVVEQVKEASLVSSSLAISKALSSRSGSKPLASSSSPLAGPSGYCPLRQAQQSRKRPAPSSRSGAANASRVVRGRLLPRRSHRPA